MQFVKNIEKNRTFMYWQSEAKYEAQQSTNPS